MYLDSNFMTVANRHAHAVAHWAVNPDPQGAYYGAIEQLLATNNTELRLFRVTAPLRILCRVAGWVAFITIVVQLTDFLPFLIGRAAAGPLSGWVTLTLILSASLTVILWASLTLAYRPLARTAKALIQELSQPEAGALRRVPCIAEFKISAYVSDQAAWDAAELLEEYAALAADAKQLRARLAPEDQHRYSPDETRLHGELAGQHAEVQRKQADLAKRIADMLAPQIQPPDQRYFSEQMRAQFASRISLAQMYPQPGPILWGDSALARFGRGDADA